MIISIHNLKNKLEAKMNKIKSIALGLMASASVFAQTQEAPPAVTPAPTPMDKLKQRFVKDGLKVYLSDDSTHWLKATCVLQAQVRNDWNNPGSTVYGYAQSQTADVGLRRLRFQIMGQVTDHFFVYVQFGMNNFNYLAPRKQGAFFHDAVAEYKVWKKKKYLSIGAGLTSLGGPLRYSAPAVGSILMADAPIYQQTTTDQSDQFGRKLGVYIKGQISKFDYRIGVGKPLPVQTIVAPNGAALVPTTGTAFDTAYATASKFSPAPAALQYQAYLKWHFFDIEANDVSYNPGTYLGKKRMLTLGAGIQYQQNAMRYWDTTSNIPSAPSATVTTTANTVTGAVTSTTTNPSATQIANYNAAIAKHLVNHNLLIVGADLFYDAPVNKEKGNAISAYGAWSYADYGNNYLRYNGVMNMTNGSNGSQGVNSKAYGNAFPMMGTGNTEFIQLAYKFKNDLLKKRGTLQPYIGIQVSQYQALQYTNMTVIDAGVNWLISGYHKISLNYQSRPVYELNAVTKNYDDIESARRGMLYLQYQISF